MNYEIWYKLQPRCFSIHEVEVAKSSDSSVWIVQRALFESQQDILKPVKRETSHEFFYKNRIDALGALEQLVNKRILKLEEELKELRDTKGHSFKLRESGKKLPENAELLV